MTFKDGFTVSPRFSNFLILQTGYKTVGDHEIRADFLIPKSLITTEKTQYKHPVIIQFHGGALIFGDSLYSPWFQRWVLQLAEKHNAIIACGNYRLLPESTGVEILSDIDDFWEWLHSSVVSGLLSSLSTPIELDLDRVIITGGSAGGFLSVYLALTYPDEIRACTASYPMLNQDGPVPTTNPEHLKPLSIESRDLNQTDNIVSSDTSEERLALTHQLIADSTLLQYIARDSAASPVRQERLCQLQRLEKLETRLPRGGIVIFHGREDTLVPAKLSERFVEVARQQLKGRQGADRITLSLQEGGHGFDVDVDLEENWLQEALQTAISKWLE